MTKFTSSEGVDSLNQEHTAGNADRMEKTLATVKKIEKLFKKVIVHQKHKKTSLKTLYQREFGGRDGTDEDFFRGVTE